MVVPEEIEVEVGEEDGEVAGEVGEEEEDFKDTEVEGM